jgi:hypothetical protein
MAALTPVRLFYLIAEALSQGAKPGSYARALRRLLCAADRAVAATAPLRCTALGANVFATAVATG